MYQERWMIVGRAEIGRFLYPLLKFRWGFSPGEISGNAVRLEDLAEIIVTA
jgi:hypothetical protein